MIKYEDRMHTKKCWEKETEVQLEVATKELSLGPGKELLEELRKLENLMMQADKHSNDKDQVLTTLQHCFPSTDETGETKDKERCVQNSLLEIYPSPSTGYDYILPCLPGTIWWHQRSN
jgi:hypothetical protein